MNDESVLPIDDQFARRALAALNQSAVAIAGELDVDKVLQLIVDAARDLAGARYAALAVGDWRATGQSNVHRFVYSGMSRDEARAVAHWPRGEGLLGAVIYNQKVIRVDDVAADERSGGFPAGHPMMTSFLGVPIVGAGETHGNLYLADKMDATSFSEGDEVLIQMLAAGETVVVGPVAATLADGSAIEAIKPEPPKP